MQAGKMVEAIGRNFPEGLTVAIARDLNPDPMMSQIIGDLTLDTITRVTGKPLQLSGEITILFLAELSNNANKYQWGLNPENGQVTIKLPERGHLTVQQLNSSLLQTVAAGALSIELIRRSTGPVTDADLQAFAATGIRVCGEILAEINEKVCLKTGEAVTLNLLEETPEITGYDFLAALGLR